MSILSDAFDGVVDFVSNFGDKSNAPQDGMTGPPTPGQVNETGKYGYKELAADVITVAGPLIATSVNKVAGPKGLKMPDAPKFPEIPDSVKNDPRVQNLLGAYGFPNAFPSIQPQDLSKRTPSALQQAFPAMLSASLGILARQIDNPAINNALTEQQKQIDTAKGTSSAEASTSPAQVAQATVVQAEASKPIPELMSQTISPMKVDGEAIRTTSKFDPMIEAAAEKYGIDPDTIRAVIHKESSGNPNAVGDGGKAIGLGQLHQAAAFDAGGRTYTKEELKDPFTNIDLTASYLSKLHKAFGGTAGDAKWGQTFGAYNQGVAGSTKPGSASQARAQKYSLSAQAYVNAIKRTGKSNVS